MCKSLKVATGYSGFLKSQIFKYGALSLSLATKNCVGISGFHTKTVSLYTEAPF